MISGTNTNQIAADLVALTFFLSGPDLPNYLSGHTQLTHKDKVIILGGRGSSANSTDTTWNHDIFE